MNHKTVMLAFSVIIMFTGCLAMPVEEEDSISNRPEYFYVNPLGHLASELDSLAEFSYEKVTDDKSSSLFTLGYGSDGRDKYESNAIYLLAGGRYYPWGPAPEGFFIHGDIGGGYYSYDLTDESAITFMLGMTAGFKVILNGFALDMGGGVMRTEFREDEQTYSRILRFQAGFEF
jgi:hypothetical protein